MPRRTPYRSPESNGPRSRQPAARRRNGARATVSAWSTDYDRLHLHSALEYRLSPTSEAAMTDRGNYTHSIMFHHFHGGTHPTGQGSLSSDEFEEMIDWLSDRHRILDANDYFSRLESNTLRETDISLSFDDALLCQADIAAPVLNRRGIKAFFFVYSSPFCGNADPLEIYRYFRTTTFDDIDSFYDEFFAQTRILFAKEYIEAQSTYDASGYLAAHPIYTGNDKWFRFLRDRVLGKQRYDEIMNGMMTRHNFDAASASKKLWMNDGHLRSLSNSGHVIGLHSYSHPTVIQQLSAKEQEAEYQRNFDHVRSAVGYAPRAMSHPCGNYSDETLSILRRIGMRVGFRSNNAVREIRSNLEIPRDDHANVFKEMHL
jgi:peptidoglycan/xylan/chitin deacetylase (PgdA/CDA1 family)